MFWMLCLVAMSTLCFAQSGGESAADTFWNNLQQHCGKSYIGHITTGAKVGDGFTGEPLVMQVLSCEKDRVRIPFYVGDDRSRTWVITRLADGRIRLKHDHRHADGSEEDVTQYGGAATNHGFAELQMFPADAETAANISYASTNVWWMTLDEKYFSYNLQRVGSDRVFTVVFDLGNAVEVNYRPWGWKD